MERQKSPHALLTGREVAELLRVHPKTVDRWRNEGKISARRTPGGAWRYPVAQLSDLGALGHSGGRHAGPEVSICYHCGHPTGAHGHSGCYSGCDCTLLWR